MTDTSTPRAMASSLRALARLLCYPDGALLRDLADVAEALVTDEALSSSTRSAIGALVMELFESDWLDIEARYVDTFDRGRRTSLHLFEHVHGDSRDRGPAMIDLMQTYAAAGLYLADGELPDFLPVVLEYASTQSGQGAVDFLGEIAHILNALHSALDERDNPYAAVIAAVLELAGEAPQRVSVQADEPVDESWAEPEPFDGCSVKGQAGAGQPQPIHIVRQPSPTSSANPSGAAA